MFVTHLEALAIGLSFTAHQLGVFSSDSGISSLVGDYSCETFRQCRGGLGGGGGGGESWGSADSPFSVHRLLHHCNYYAHGNNHIHYKVNKLCSGAPIGHCASLSQPIQLSS